MTRSFVPLAFLVLMFATAQGAFAWVNRDRRPDLEILDPPVSGLARSVVAFGDDQFLYRAWSYELQNAGDTGGRSTPMRDYNYDNVIDWLTALQDLDARAQSHTFLAAEYFTQTPRMDDVRRVTEFLIGDVEKNPALKWSWLFQAMDKAERVLHDEPYMLEISYKLAAYDFPDMSPWAWLFPAVILEKLGRYDEAQTVVEGVRTRKKEVLDKETLAWMDGFELGLLKH